MALRTKRRSSPLLQKLKSQKFYALHELAEDVQYWWTRTGIGAVLINVYCRAAPDQKYEAVRHHIETLSDFMRESRRPIIEEMLKIDKAMLLELLEYAVEFMKACTAVPVNVAAEQQLLLRSRDLPDKSNLCGYWRRQIIPLPTRVGEKLLGWNSQFLSMLPPGVPHETLAALQQNSAGAEIDEIRGPLFRVFLPEVVCAFMVTPNQEWVLPMGCTFVVESIGINNVDFEIRLLPQPLPQTPPDLRVDKETAQLIIAAEKVVEGVSLEYRDGKIYVQRRPNCRESNEEVIQSLAYELALAAYPPWGGPQHLAEALNYTGRTNELFVIDEDQGGQNDSDDSEGEFPSMLGKRSPGSRPDKSFPDTKRGGGVAAAAFVDLSA